ncbi:unnamed protein product [Prorocentrum cordatum]|uniref:Transmembrane protein 107 n=1 Tax=Prorocentrum cordatum TaxID=2364126 RepID=A0ABN9T8L9_9DINO|nr:unnamed protein product [Polarella glacialis]
MPAIHHLLEQTQEGDVEKVREEMISAFATVGVVAALVLTMDKMSEKVDEEMDFDGDWLDCDRIACSEIHVVLSCVSFMCCVHAVAFTTCVVLWLSLTPPKATKDFFYTFPLSMVRPAEAMMVGMAAWALDQMFLAFVRHGTHVMMWLAIPAAGLTGHCLVMWWHMRKFAWHWPDPQYVRQPRTEPSEQPLIPPNNAS